MIYSLLIDGSTVLTGNLITVLVLVLIVLVILCVIIKFTWKKVHENQVIKYEFIAIIAHKFRTPLTSVKWIIENLSGDEKDSYKLEQFQNIQKSNEKLIALTQTLVELTNENKGEVLHYVFEPTPIYDFVRSVGDRLQSTFHEKNIFFAVQCTDTNLVANINRTGMDFVIQAILENSCIYSPPGRRVDVIISKHHRKVLISIVDNGIGIQAQDLKKIFSKFYRAGNAKRMDTEGFGISLYMAQSIVKRNKGKIKVYSAGTDQGSTFTITLPLL